MIIHVDHNDQENFIIWPRMIDNAIIVKVLTKKLHNLDMQLISNKN